MLRLRKIDCYGQVILGSLAILSMLILFGSGLLIGFLIISCWQVISAIFNTKSFMQAGFQKRILVYWTVCITDLLLMFLTYSSIGLTPDKIVAEVLSVTTLFGAAAVTVYYWKIYFKLIGFISLRNELDGLTKSKH